MTITKFIGDHRILIVLGVVGIFCIWKFLIQPLMNEGRPIKPGEKELNQFALLDLEV